MNIDTSTISSSSELKNNLMSAQTSKLGSAGNSFQSQLSSLSSNNKADNTSDSKSTNNTSDAKEDTSIDDDKTVDTKSDEKPQNSENKQDNSVKNDEKQQNQQQGNSQNNNQQNPNQNQASAELSDEINSILKLNGRITDISQLQNQKFTTGINQDIYTSSAAIDYSRISMSDNDAMFFVNLVNKTDMSMQSIAGEFQKNLNTANVQNVQKTAKVSATLMEALSDSMKTNKAFRIDFDKDVSVVMRVDRDGNINANFIPGDKAVEAYLKNNISYLKQRFDEQNLPYNELTYSKHNRQNQQEEKRNNKENDNE